ncbi:MAG: hypothetical protein US57_C0006G0086 [Candidatus Moranbacteria bacterium GW2011_GWC2_37_73]|nr:MAG: hypothetical protein UR95_C0007G0089 [Parcubacteria group bacterium GW2011_GWC1_36_108]KKQ00122.1 MAG: hypothetical protein US09_C0020G0004 [Candidatus Moranbacteria bacterium GW2011_GWD1_36_198]KKQ01293.1 MAG: hypothetical protein US10_C0019G0004 [Candidatus Moranbacteria bacterium GW2011_GWD2_36_198]KKQ40014.1 MAG: hypothetical protein US57_C0006G0086 [Candidatus Moranbacteria bacterium GW2011_GWC2_37_73]HAS00222.1 hypothetical protein [Candidatus Moranbacteria bacterium]
MLKKIISHISKKDTNKEKINFFDLPVAEQQKIIRKAADLSAQDQKDLLKEYERKFGELQTNSCK